MLILSYKAYHKYDSSCGLEIRINRNNTITVILTELPSNPGITVTYLIEHVATLIYCEYLRGVPAENIIWLKRDPEIRHGDKKIAEGSYKQALLVWNGQTFGSPRWISLPSEDWERYGIARPVKMDL
jgi:hypothetical protein